MRKMYRVILVGKEENPDLAASLSKTGRYSVTGPIHDGFRAMELIREMKPDIVITDLVLPKADGITVLEAAAALEKRPLMLLLADFLTDFVLDLLSAVQVDYFLLKPGTFQVVERLNDMCDCLETHLPRTHAQDLKETISATLREIGISAHFKGYPYLREAIMIVMDDESVIDSVTKTLYPLIAKRFGTTSTQVERVMRHAIQKAWDTGDADVWQRIFGQSVLSAGKKPTNSQFVATLADELRLTLAKLRAI